jgi:hypothetical protein
MSLWQLMRWLGHRTEETTRHYVDADIPKVAVKVAEGSFLQQNLASIPVLIDNAVVSGSASWGHPWKFFDLGAWLLYPTRMGSMSASDGLREVRFLRTKVFNQDAPFGGQWQPDPNARIHHAR